jgi:hypothetical protein
MNDEMFVALTALACVAGFASGVVGAYLIMMCFGL